MCKINFKLTKLAQRCSWVIVAALFIPAAANAQTNDFTTLLKYLTQVVNATVKTVANMVYEWNPSLPVTVSTNTQQNSAKQLARKNAIDMSLTQIKNALTDADTDELTQLAAIPASDTLYQPSAVFPIFGGKTTIDLAKGNATFSFENLFSPNSYAYVTAQQHNAATNFIKFLNYQPATKPLDTTTLTNKQKIQLQQNPVFQKYQVINRASTASRSVAIGNLDTLVAARTPKNINSKELLPLQGTKFKDIANASSLQLEHYIATRRISDSQWYANMAKASPATVQREQLNVLAEVEALLFQLHLDNQRIIASLAAQQLQSAALESIGISQAQQQAQSAITAITSKKAVTQPGGLTAQQQEQLKKEQRKLREKK